MFALLLFISISINFQFAFCHQPLNWFIVESRTCPYESDMEQRTAQFFEALYLKSVGNSYATTTSYMNIFDQEHAFIALPSTIEDSLPYFTYGEFQMGLLDFSGHTAWNSLDSIVNGANESQAQFETEYGIPTTSSFDNWLTNLPYSVNIVPGTSYYQCDNEGAWGFGSGTVFIREKQSAGNSPRNTYVGSAQIITTFHKVMNKIGNDEWMMQEMGVFWDIYD